MRKYVFFAISILLTSQTILAYKQEDIIKLAAPIDTPIILLLGYDSNTGKFVEQCVKAKKLEKISGKDPASQASFRYVRSMHEVLKEENLDVTAKLSVQFPVGGGSAEVNVSQFKSNLSQIEQGMVYGTFRDLVKPQFLSPSVNISLNENGKQKITQSRRKGNPTHFRKACGDSVVIGFQKDRYIRVFGSLESSSNQSITEKSTDLRLAARYLMSKFSTRVNLSTKEKSDSKDINISIKYSASGNAKLPNATNLRQLKKNVWNKFSALDLKDTLTISYFYIVQYEDLLSKDDFGIGVSRKELRRIEKIVNGLFVLDHARSVAGQRARYAKNDIERGKYRNTRDRLAKEIMQARLWLKDNKGCFGKKGNSRSCKNLIKRFANFDNVGSDKQMNSFVKLAARPTTKVCSGYPVTDPSGRTECKSCVMAKQPIFLGGKDGACGYLATERKSKDAVRLWTNNLKTIRNIEAEAGVKTAVVEHPNYCNKRGKKCGQPMADIICKKAGYKKSLEHQVWHPGGLGVVSARPRTIYADGKKCRSNPDGFDKKLCKTFLYVDCGKS